MAHRIDVSLKTLFLRPGDGIIRRRLFGGKVAEHISTEQPRVSNNRADMVVRTEDDTFHQVEFQTYNEPGFGARMVEYYGYLVRAHGRHVVQTVLYLGRDPMRLERGFTSPSTAFRFEIVNLREFDAGPLIESEDWADNALALLAKGGREKALEVALVRLGEMKHEDQMWASGTLVILSGILDMEEAVTDRLREAGMINIMENKVLGPMILEKIEAGRRDLLREQLIEKFGALPGWAEQRLDAATEADVHTWAKRVLRAESLEATLE